MTLMDMVILADQNGVVDMTHEAIARRTNRPIDVIRQTITELEAADPRSRNPNCDGARIQRLDDHRDWGWLIVNYEQFRQTASEEQRREKTRARVHKHRQLHNVTLCNARNAKQKHKHKHKKKESTIDLLKKAEETVVETTHLAIQTERIAKASHPPAPNLVPTIDDIYNAYPHKVGRPDAYRAIGKCLRGIKPHTEKFGASFLLERTIAFSKARNGDREFCPNPATWFNQERFNDDPATWTRALTNSQKPKLRAPVYPKLPPVREPTEAELEAQRQIVRESSAEFMRQMRP